MATFATRCSMPALRWRAKAALGPSCCARPRAALALLAREIEAEVAAARRLRDPRRRARAAFRGVGLGYLRFARQEPGLFRTAFVAQPFDLAEFAPDDAAPRGASGMDPFELLGRTLDGMVDAGLLPPAQRPGAEFMAWSAVHGLAMLMLDGPLRGVGEAESRALTERLVTMIEQGLLAASDPAQRAQQRAGAEEPQQVDADSPDQQHRNQRQQP